jgi:hypothetical protein
MRKTAFVTTFGLVLAGVLCVPDGSNVAGAPYPASSAITGVTFDWTTHQRLAPGSDNWPVTWASDNHQYSSWGDGSGFGPTNPSERASLGFARIEGSASNYQGHNVWGGNDAPNATQFNGKSYGILAIGSTLYAWRCGDGSMETAYRFQKLYVSTNGAASWTDTGVEFTPGDFGATQGFFCPTFLQFGKGYQGARDSYVYIYAPEIKSQVWEVHKPGEITLMRVPMTGIADRDQYEFYRGTNGSGSPQWTADPAQRRPVFSDAANGVMRTSASYNSGLDRYLLITEHTARSGGNIGIYEAPEPWGPWRTVLFQSQWGSPTIEATTFFWNFSNKWLSSDGKDFVLVFTGTGTNDSWNTVRGQFATAGGQSGSQRIYVPLIRGR